MDYELPKISSETKYFAGDKQDRENKFSPGSKYNGSTTNFMSIFEGNSRKS